jgi:biotin carboxyl carrier protein
MPEIKIVTEVAGRICATPVQVGGTVADGDEIVVVEAMKMEIPVPSPANGTITSLLVKLDDIVAEGQAIARSSRAEHSLCQLRDNLSASSPHARYGVAIV